MLCAMWTAAGWYIFLAKTFSRTIIRTKTVSTVDGLGAQFIGFTFVVLGLIAMAIVLQSLSLRRSVKVLLFLLGLVVPPLLMQTMMKS